MTKLAAVILLVATRAFAQPALPDAPPAEPPPLVWDTTPMPAPQRVVRGQVTVAAKPDTGELAGTSEVGFGVGQWRVSDQSVSGFAPSFGFGRFVAPQVALTFRVAGVGIIEDAYGFIGLAGPHAQVWLADQAFLGLGAGLAFGGAVGAGGGGGDLTAGVEARVGFAFQPKGKSGANATVEVTTFHELETMAVLLGYQSF